MRGDASPAVLVINPDLSWRRFGEQAVVFNGATGDTMLVAPAVVDFLESVGQSRAEINVAATDVKGRSGPSAVGESGNHAENRDELMQALLANDFVRRGNPCV